MKRAIFNYYNYQINPQIPKLHHEVVRKYNNVENCDFYPLEYTKPDGQMFPDDAIHYGMRELFAEKEYDTVLLLEVDCIPLHKDSFNYMFKRAEEGVLIGNGQRSMHIDNNQHVFVAPSAFCISASVLKELGAPGFNPTTRGDIAEEYTYRAEEMGLPIEFLKPQSFIRRNIRQDRWDLGDDGPEYGIGTTFINKEDTPMFFHLFETRYHIWNDLFYDKCRECLNNY